MSTSISIFEIPLLIKSLCQSLDPVAILACRRVCKSWDSLFSPYEWESVCIITATETCELPEDEDFIPLQQNAILVRNLVLDNSRLFESLLYPYIHPHSPRTEQQDITVPRLTGTQGFVRLLSLTCDMVHRSDGDQDWSFLDYPTLLPALIQLNPGLRYLHIRELDTTNAKYNAMLFPTIGRHPTLGCLRYNIHSSITNLNWVVIRQIFRSIPESLRSLCIATRELVAVTEYFDEHGGTVVGRFKEGDQDWHPTRLQSLDINLDFRGYEELLLFPILRSCPHLTSPCVTKIEENKLEPLGKLLREHCPKLVAIDHRT